MTINRYRLLHMAKDKHRGAILVSRLLSHPDRLLGLILFGNNLVNISAASVATVITLKLVGEEGIFIILVDWVCPRHQIRNAGYGQSGRSFLKNDVRAPFHFFGRSNSNPYTTSVFS